MRKLYLECTTGISGDMFVAALLDLGADQDKLMQVLQTIPEQEFKVSVSRVKKAGLDVCDFDVRLEHGLENHDHDMGYLYGTVEGGSAHGHVQEHTHSHAHAHLHEHSHSHAQSHEHSHSHVDGHVHRGMKEILEIIRSTEMTEGARTLAERIFTILGEAEAKAHGTTLEAVHFHEVGAVDSIVDIISAAVCMDDLQVSGVIIPSLSEGTGSVRCQHGILPVPVPAVMHITEACGLVLHRTDRKGELITPTGAAIAGAICTENRLPETYRILKSGTGAGKREYEIPSLLRAMLIEESEPSEEKICKLETNVDDCTGEMLGYTMERLFQAGARDVSFQPIYMKKNRPGYQLNVICLPEQVPAMETIIFEETTTIGIRRCLMDRTVLNREKRTVNTAYGEMDVKVCSRDGLQRVYPEYESVAKISRDTGKPLKEIYDRMGQELNGEGSERKKGTSGNVC